MNPVPPHHLLSAYLDGELSANEREQVERLLEESSEARQEIRELEQVGEWLRQLPREALPETFASNLLNVCQSDTSVVESETLTPEFPSSVANSKPRANVNRHNFPLSPKRKNGWLGFASVGVSAAALGLIVLLSLTKPREQDRAEIALSTPTNDLAGKSGFREKLEADHRDLPMAASDGISVNALQEGQLGASKKLNATEGHLASEIAKAHTLAGLGPGGVDRKPAFVFNKDLKEVPVAQVVLALGQQDEQVAVVKLLVGNRRQGLRDLKTLLQRHQIALTNPSVPLGDTATLDQSDKAKSSSMLAVYVEASDEQLAAAIQDLQQESSFQKLMVEAPVAVAQLDPLMVSPKAGFRNNQRRTRMMQFGGGGFDVPESASLLPRAMKTAPAPNPSDTAASAEEKKPTEPLPKPNQAKPASVPEPAKNRSVVPGEKSPPSKAPAPNFGVVAGSDALPGLGDGIPQAEKRDNATKTKMPNGAVGGRGTPATLPSTQRELTLSAKLLESLQQQMANRPSANPTEAKTTEAKTDEVNGAGTQPIPTVRRVQILFILVDEATKTGEPAPTPAGNTPPSADNNNGAP